MKYIPAIISFALLGAHFLRANDFWLMCFFMLFPFTFFIKRKWPINVSFIVLLISSLIWVRTTAVSIMIRVTQEAPWTRMTLIFSAVILFTVFSAFLLKSILKDNRYIDIIDFPKASTSAFLISNLLLTIAKLKVKFPILIVDRFVPGSGWVEIFLLSVYAAWLTEKMMDKNRFAKYRLVIWMLFSFVFFIQLILGLSGIERFLMTGHLHFPIPALIVAGPIYRGYGLFMPVLLGISLLIIGPAWCSFLCYIGAWDLQASRSQKKPLSSPAWVQKTRVIILISVICIAYLLRILGLSVTVVSVLALLFGLGGIVMMLLWSRKRGVMMHCISYCPIGVITTWLGKISLFRIRIGEGCTACNACVRACRYDALKFNSIQNDKPGISCTLCGDCIGSCKEKLISYKFLKLSHDNARTLFIVLAVSMHTVFMAVARL